jgi:molybdate transport system substrate-binding protein
MRRLVLLALAVFALRPAIAAEAPLIAAAASLQGALRDAAAAFTAETGIAPRLVFGASGNLVRQIEQGAPFEVFMSADEAFVLRLATGGQARDEGVVYGVGRIALFAPAGSPVDVTRGLDGLRDALAAGRITRFAIANPELAPYGLAAQQALTVAGLWDQTRPRLVIGENISQAAQFATAGGSQGGIIALSLALSPGVRARGAHSLLPEDMHAPLRQRMALMRRAGPAADRFFAWLQTPAAQSILAAHGFTPPGE